MMSSAATASIRAADLTAGNVDISGASDGYVKAQSSSSQEREKGLQMKSTASMPHSFFRRASQDRRPSQELAMTSATSMPGRQISKQSTNSGQSDPEKKGLIRSIVQMITPKPGGVQTLDLDNVVPGAREDSGGTKEHNGSTIARDPATPGSDVGSQKCRSRGSSDPDPVTGSSAAVSSSPAAGSGILANLAAMAAEGASILTRRMSASTESQGGRRGST